MLKAARFNPDRFVDNEGNRHPSLFNRTGVQSEDELLKLEPVNPRFKEGCMLLALTIVELFDNCTRPEFVAAHTPLAEAVRCARDDRYLGGGASSG